MPERQALLEAAARLEVATEELGRKFEAVDLFAHETAHAAARTRQLMQWLMIGLVTLALMVGLLGWVADKADDANSRSVRTVEYQVASCEAANETRAAQRALWDKVFELTSDPDDSKAERQEAAAFLKYVNNVFADRDCAKVTQGKVK